MSRAALALDPAVPQRDRLVDADVIARRLSASLGGHRPVAIRTCRVGCISYRPGRRLRVVYHLSIDGRPVHVAAATFRSARRAERAYELAMESAVTTARLRPVVYDGELLTVFWTYPNDRRIESLPAAAGALDDVRELVDVPWTTSRLVDYYPEATAVLRCLDESSRTVAYAKVHAGDEGERTHLVQRELARRAEGSRVRVARPLAYSKRYKTTLVEPVEGRSLGRLGGAEQLRGLRAYGAALAALHSLGPVETGARRDSLGRLGRNAEGIRSARPDVAEQVAELVGELGARWDAAAGEPVPVHGDANENNAILRGDRVALIDFDRSSTGAAASDVGNFLGLLRYLRSLGIISPRSVRSRSAALTGGYASVRALPDRESLRVHESAAVAERAFRAVTRLRAAALDRVPELLAEARALLP